MEQGQTTRRRSPALPDHYAPSIPSMVSAPRHSGDRNHRLQPGPTDELGRKGSGYIELFKGLIAEIGPTLDEVKFVDPDLTYDGQAEIDLGGTPSRAAQRGSSA